MSRESAIQRSIPRHERVRGGASAFRVTSWGSPATVGSTLPAMSSGDLPQRARVVVVGGGVIGCSVAYHLAVEGWTDVVLLERDQLTSGTTWHSAGLIVTFGSLSETSTQMRLY